MTEGVPKVEQELIEQAHRHGLTTGRDRLEEMSPQCGFGELGTCCKICYMGPCRIDPFGEGPSTGVCGATADTIVARNLLREALGGASSHVGHARELLVTLHQIAIGEIKDYEIKGVDKLKGLCARMEIDTEGKSTHQMAEAYTLKAMADFGNLLGGTANYLKYRCPPKELEMLRSIGIAYSNPHEVIEVGMHRTSMGNDADTVNLMLAVLRTGLVDGFHGLVMCTDISDILFGVPKPTQLEANVGVLDANSVNLVLHGHNPLLSEKILEWSEKLEGEAKAVGADRVNIVGVCCTGNELSMRHGVPMAGHNLQSELILHTGAVDGMVVDIQCIWPYSTKAAKCYGTPFMTTDPMVKLPGAKHIQFDHHHANDGAKEIVREAIGAFNRRKGRSVHIPAVKSISMVGFSVEALIEVLSKVDAENPLKPVIDNIIEGNIQGVVGIVGCPSLKRRDIGMTEVMTRELLANNVLVVGTGCISHILGQAGFLDSSGVEKYCGDGLKAVLTVLGEAAGLGAPLPPVWHMGSCVDNSRIFDLLGALAGVLDVKISQLPVAGSAPELVQEKAISIGASFLALGVTTHISPAPHILGSPVVTKILTEDLPNITGGRAYVEDDPVLAAQGLIKIIQEKRKALNI